MCDTFPERCVPGGVLGVGFMLINAVLCLQSQFVLRLHILHNQIFKDIAFVCHLTKNYKLLGKAKVSMASCTTITETLHLNNMQEGISLRLIGQIGQI